jgi:hypothetical protein
MSLYVCEGVAKELYQIDLDGSDPILLFSTSMAPYWPIYHPASGKFFYTHTDVYSIDEDGTNETKIVDHADFINGLAIDASGGKLYYTVYDDYFPPASIRRCDFDGSNEETLFTANKAARVQVDIARGKCYWITQDIPASGEIRRSDMNGDNEELLITEYGTVIEQMALDLVNDTMYWVNSSMDRISMSNLDGTNRVVIVTPTADVWGIVVDPVGGKVYWTETSPGSVKRADLDGSNPEVIWSGVPFPAFLYLTRHDESVQVASSRHSWNNCTLYTRGYVPEPPDPPDPTGLPNDHIPPGPGDM